MKYLQLDVFNAVRLSNMLTDEQPANPDHYGYFVDYQSLPAQQRMIDMIDAQILHNLPLVLWLEAEQIEILCDYTVGMIDAECQYSDPIPVAFLEMATR